MLAVTRSLNISFTHTQLKHFFYSLFKKKKKKQTTHWNINVYLSKMGVNLFLLSKAIIILDFKNLNEGN